MSELLRINKTIRTSQTNVWCSYFVVKIKPAQISSFCCSPVSVSESSLYNRNVTVNYLLYKLEERHVLRSVGSHQALESFGYNGSKSLLSCQLWYEEDVFWSRDLVRPVSSPCEQTNKSRRFGVFSNPNPIQDGPQGLNIYWPNCCIALSALHGSSSVMWTLRRWFFTRRSACSEIPELAASEMMAMFWIEGKERHLRHKVPEPCLIVRTARGKWNRCWLHTVTDYQPEHRFIEANWFVTTKKGVLGFTFRKKILILWPKSTKLWVWND